jgi:exodeoxyribonuclease V gamma subunit
MERQRRLGDPHPADQDRYVLLEALLSARSHLLITWSSRDDRSGEPLPPAGPVRQWLQWLEGQLDEGALARLVADHPAGPLERGHFLPSGGRPPASCDRRRLEARRRLEQDPPAPPHPLVSSPALAPPAPEASLSAPADRTADLAAWLRAPQKQWLQQLGMRPQEWMERLEDLEPLELEERQRFQLLRPLLAPGSLEDPRRPEQWLERNRGQGTLPAGAAGALEAQALAERWSSLQETLESLGEPWQEPLDWGGWQATPLWRGDTVVVVHPGRPNPGVHMELWLHLQVAAAAAAHSGRTPAQAALIARDGNRLVVERRLQAPEPQAAREELERLAALREEWRQACWPVPPRSGWAWCERERDRAGTGFAEVVKVWEGDGHARAEGQAPEMVVCFGAERPALELVDGAFGERAMALYDAVLAAVIRPPRRGKGE